MKPEIVDCGSVTEPLGLLLGLTEIISGEWFNFRLLLHAHVSILLSSAEHDWVLVAGMIR